MYRIATLRSKDFLNTIKISTSQISQDIFVLTETKFKQNGYFVEFGATNGLSHSNTYILEKDFGWKGILAEPARIWHEELHRNRPNSSIETRCIWKDSKSKLLYHEAAIPDLSTIQTYSDSDCHKNNRFEGKEYYVSTISLNDLLDKYDAPRYIDYLSIDTEGSEFEILNAIDFSRHTFGIVTCEHNYSPKRDLIYALMKENGYRRKYKKLSRFDDWYVKDVD